MRVHVRRTDGGAVIRIEGTFDTSEVDQVVIVARGLWEIGPIVLDFHGAEVPSDLAVVQLATRLQQQGHRRFMSVGLSEHHHRLLLQYLGAETSEHPHRDPVGQ